MKKVIISVLICISLRAFAQNTVLIVPSNILLPRDSTVKKNLLSSLKGLLSKVEAPNRENPFVLAQNLAETSALLDEFKGLSYSRERKDSLFYKCHLTSVVKLNDSAYSVQLAYMGAKNGEAFLRAAFTLEARRLLDSFFFSSPLKHNTLNWKSEKMGINTVHYKSKINKVKAKQYFGYVDRFDKRLNAPPLPYDLYCCDNFIEVQKLLGVDYKLDFNGYSRNSLSSDENGCKLSVNGVFTPDFDFDPHDLWHDRLHNVLSTKIINKPVDEGAAYLYGGSWGLSWEEIQNRFRFFVNANPNADWLTLYNESKNFDEKARYPLNVDYMINALLVSKIEKEKGFEAVMELLSCGKYEKSNAGYFAALGKITGITQENFNSKIQLLVDEIK